METTTNFVDMFTQCTGCGCIVEVISCDNVGDFIKDQEQQINEISVQLSVINDQLGQAPDKPKQKT